MKNLFLTIILSLSLSSFANDECIHCDENPGVPVNQQLDMFVSISSKATNVLKKTNEKKLKAFVKKLCLKFENATKVGKDSRETVKIEILRFLGEPDNSPKKDKLTQTFMNRYNSHLYCEDTYKFTSSRRPRQHLFKLFIDFRRDDQFYNEWLAKQGNRDRPSFNAIQKVNGKNETLLDYIEFLVNSGYTEYNPKELKRLMRRLRRAGARKAEELV